MFSSPGSRIGWQGRQERSEIRLSFRIPSRKEEVEDAKESERKDVEVENYVEEVVEMERAVVEEGARSRLSASEPIVTNM